jgi:activating signal cointegrator complex subunit 3
MTILHELEKHVDPNTNRIIDSNFKVIYISPMKALASEIVEKFSTMLSHIGVLCKELTGDMQLTKKEIEETHIIVTTPEKWDVFTRKKNEVAETLVLLIIDEIHLLNDERGPVLECLVSRTL